jgi:lipopolysaccharide/colanic/teichoic acid biosynthesis glycosyltransferase
MKRLADLAIAATLLAITAPLMLVVALAIKWETPGPVFDRQTCLRGSRRGCFQTLKFRTTRTVRVAASPPNDLADEWLHRQELPPRTFGWTRKRTTRVGHLIEPLRIERLPLLINLLRGEIHLLDRGADSPSIFDFDD